MPQHPAWYLKLKSQLEATIQVKGQHIQVKAETANPEQRGEMWARLMEVVPGYANYEKRTTRQIPVVILHPLDGTDEEPST